MISSLKPYGRALEEHTCKILACGSVSRVEVIDPETARHTYTFLRDALSTSEKIR